MRVAGFKRPVGGPGFGQRVNSGLDDPQFALLDQAHQLQAGPARISVPGSAPGPLPINVMPSPARAGRRPH